MKILLLLMALVGHSPDSFADRWPPQEWIVADVHQAPDPRSHFATEQQP
jgi:hypothetical protein